MEIICNVDAHKSPALLCYIASKLFEQQWLFEKGDESNTNYIKTDHDSEELSPLVNRRWTEIGHLDFFLPTRKSRKMVALFSLIWYNDTTVSIVNANAKDQTVSYISW